MAKLHGFRYKYVGAIDEQYIMLEKSVSGELRLLVRDRNKGDSIIQITDKVNDLCNKLCAMSINDWNGKEFKIYMEFFPSYDWELTIEADGINVSCKGSDCRPADWECLIKIMEDIGCVIR